MSTPKTNPTSQTEAPWFQDYAVVVRLEPRIDPVVAKQAILDTERFLDALETERRQARK